MAPNTVNSQPRRYRYSRAFSLSARQLPNPVAENWDWQLHAHCKYDAIETFFPTTGLKHRERLRLEQRAKDICSQCPVITECRSFAMQSAEPYGIWGGLTPRERAMRIPHRTADERPIHPH
ncbi:WhiB family transcriptional regulator [Rhodococcus sp. Eu-32]|uniref:WhiB family transcriptional regulator n=1 Tax=Rhodococcus sp. Eu-32 TaxID=1017319 RepID=UPI000DF33FAE|nr:WhiB family transcriptional regulator [Rhodococcus sp. Eu-32]RRQ24989.1 WhiB family transcriptional regulator [Rhodococcus sp. Eu-32]